VPRPSKKKRYTHTLLVDGNSLLKTAYHGAKNLYHKETHIGGIFQFLTIVRKVINENRFDRIIVFWDGKFSGRLRYLLYKDYKGNRDKDFFVDKEPSNPELYLQKERVKLYLEELFIRQYEDEIVEADDAIGYYCNNIKDDEKVLIITNDGDIFQLLGDRVGIYSLKKKKIITQDNYVDNFEYHHSNIKLVKMLSGDSSDHIKGIKGIGVPTLLKYFPEIVERSLTLEDIFSKIKHIQEEREKDGLPRLKPLDNILNKVTLGCQGEDIFEINERIINLRKPLLTEESRDGLNLIFDSPIDPEGRTTKNIMKMMLEDGLFTAIPGGRDGYINYLNPFLRIIRKENDFFNKTKNN
jgi:5'-3' exonuclease